MTRNLKPASARRRRRSVSLLGIAIVAIAACGNTNPRNCHEFSKVFGIIVLPQAIRSVIGPMGSVLIALTKNTIIASAIVVAWPSTCYWRPMTTDS